MNGLGVNEEVDVPPAVAEETIVATRAHSETKQNLFDFRDGIDLDFEPHVREGGKRRIGKLDDPAIQENIREANLGDSQLEGSLITARCESYLMRLRNVAFAKCCLYFFSAAVDDEYGGMPAVIYDAIVRYKKEGRMRCTRFMLSWGDDETLLYYNDQNGNNETPRFVVKKGEVRSILQRVHEMIGHLGMKRTQYAVLRRLYWRSVRADVRKFINNCDFCTKKKNDGKKLFKASFDILGDKVDIEVALRPVEERSQHANRFLLTLIGLDEQTVKQNAQTQLVSYTFRIMKHTGRRHEVLPVARRKHMKRLPIRSFCGGANEAHQTSQSRRYIEVEELGHATLEIPDATYGSSRYSNNETASSIRFKRSSPVLRDSGVDGVLLDEQIDDGVIICEDHRLPSTVESTHPSHSRFPIIAMRSRYKRGSQTSSADSSLRPNNSFKAYTASTSTARLLFDSDCRLTPYDVARDRPSLTGLSRIMLIPSSDPEVVQLQKEVLRRQKSIQILQEKVLLAQYERLYATGHGSGEESPAVRYDREVIDIDGRVQDEANFCYESSVENVDTSRLHPHKVMMVVGDKWT